MLFYVNSRLWQYREQRLRKILDITYPEWKLLSAERKVKGLSTKTPRTLALAGVDHSGKCNCHDRFKFHLNLSHFFYFFLFFIHLIFFSSRQSLQHLLSNQSLRSKTLNSRALAFGHRNNSNMLRESQRPQQTCWICELIL